MLYNYLKWTRMERVASMWTYLACPSPSRRAARRAGKATAKAAKARSVTNAELKATSAPTASFVPNELLLEDMRGWTSPTTQ